MTQKSQKQQQMNINEFSSPSSIQKNQGDDDCPPDLLSPRVPTPPASEVVTITPKKDHQEEDKKTDVIFTPYIEPPQSMSIRSPRCLEDEEFNYKYTSSLLSSDQLSSLKLDKNVLSNQFAYAPKSFLKMGPYQKFNPKVPPPIYMDYDQIKKTRDLDIKDIMNGIIIPEKGGFQCVDADVLNRQKGLMTQVIKQVIICVLKRQPISGISLPVRVFEPRSQIERMLDTLGFAPVFFKRAAMTTDKLERLKLVVTNVISGMYGSAKQLKPFNPLLGETYQGYFEDGTRIFCEHTSHHPPISNFLIEGPPIENHEEAKIQEETKESTMNKRLWKLSGFYQFTGEKDGDSFKVGQKGPNRLVFYDGHKIEWINPVFKLSVSGSRYMNYTGDITFYDQENRVKATIILDHTKEKNWLGQTKRKGKTDDFQGVIYNINQQAFISQGFSKNKIYDWKHPNKIKDIKDMKGEPICKIEGSWLKNITFDSKQYWNMLDPSFKPHPQRGSKCPLPSDWRYREDLIWLKYKNQPFADAWKKELEKMQRLDRKWRSQKKKK